MKRFFAAGLLCLLSLFALARPPRLDSANLTSVKDTLQSSRLSVHARVDSTGTAVGSSGVKLLTSSGADSAGDNAYTISTANLHAGDSLTIGTGSYTIVDIIDADEFTVTPVLASGDADNTDPVYLNLKPRHVITFSTATAVADGFFQILLPADSDATTNYDGLADDSGFDFTAGSIDVVATDVGVYDFVTGVATRSGDTGCTAPSNYHCFEVHYSGAGSIGQAITINIGNTGGTNTPVAPASGSSHTEGTADTYTFIVKNFPAGSDPNSATPIDTTNGKIALIEAVRVTATVDPTITFTIAGVDTATSICGATPDIDTTTGTNAPLAVPFGTLTLNTFKDAGHNLTVSTNAQSGYAVTASEDDELGLNGATSPAIPDTPGNNSLATEGVSDEWTTSTVNGFGYSLENVDAASIAFEYTTSSGNCTGTFCARQFANIAASDSPQTLFSSTTVANAQNAYVCYRLSVGATQQAGDYENLLTYTATGTF